MKKSFILLAVLLLSAVTGFAQIFYQRTYKPSNTSFNNHVTWSASDQTYILLSHQGNGNMIITKTDATGQLLWSTEYMFPGGMVMGAPKAVVASDGTIFVGGRYQLTGNVGYFIACFYEWGDLFWTKGYNSPSVVSYAEPALELLPDGNLMIMESVYGHLGYIKIDPAGGVISSTIYRENISVENKTPGLASDVFADASMIFTGKRSTDFAIVRTDMNGQVLWTRVLNAGDSLNSYYSRAVLALSDGSAIICGSENSYPFLMRIDAGGSMLWYRAFAGNGQFTGLAELDPVSFGVSGNVNGKAVLAQCDLNGNVIQALGLSDPDYTYFGGDIVVNPAGVIAWACGYYENQAQTLGTVLTITDNFNPAGCGLTSFALTPTVVLLPYAMPIPLYALPQALTTFSLNGLPYPNAPLYQDLCMIIGVEEAPAKAAGLTVLNTLVNSAAPLTFSMSGEYGEASYRVFDLNGRKVLDGSVETTGGALYTVEATQLLTAGMYVFNVSIKGKMYTEKFVVQ